MDPESELAELRAAEAEAEKDDRVEEVVQRHVAELEEAKQQVDEADANATLSKAAALEAKKELQDGEKRWEGERSELLRTIAQLEKAKALDRAECDHLTTRIKDLTRHKEDLEAALQGLQKKLAEVEGSAHRDEVRNTASLAALDTELQQARKKEEAIRQELERLERENQKNLITINLFKNLIEHKDEGLAKLKEDYHVVNTERQKVVEELDLLKNDVQVLRKAFEERQEEQLGENRELAKMLESRDMDLQRAMDQVAELNAGLDRNKKSLLEHMQTAQRRDKEAYAEGVGLRKDIARLQQRLDEAVQDFASEKAEAALVLERVTRERDEMAETRERETQAFREREDVLVKELVEVKAAHEALKLKHAAAEGKLLASDRDSFEKIRELTEEMDRLKVRMVEMQATGAELERMHTQEVTQLRAKLASAEARIDELVTEAEEKEKKSKDTALSTMYERDTLVKQINERNQELEVLRKQQYDLKVDCETKLTLSRRKEQDLKLDYNAVCLSLESRIRKLEGELAAVSSTVSQAQEEAEKAKEDLAAERELAAKREIALRAEVEGYKQTVKQLEGQVIGEYDKKELVSQNEELRGTLQLYKNQISSLNHTIASIRIECEVVELHKTKALQESNMACLAQIRELKETVETQQALLGELVPVVDQADSGCPPHLRSELKELVKSLRTTQQKQELALVPRQT